RVPSLGDASEMRPGRPTAAVAMSDVTRIFSAIEQGDEQAAGQLLPLVYDVLRQLAAREKPGHTLQPTPLLPEAFIFIWTIPPPLPLRRRLSFPVFGFSRTLDDDSRWPMPNGRESRGNRGSLCRLTALDHRECGRTAIWHGFFAGTAGRWLRDR